MENTVDVLKNKIKENIKNSTQTVYNTVVDVLVKKEVDSRVELIMKALDKKEVLEKEVLAIKPDNVMYNEDGTVASQNYTKQNLDNKKDKERKLKEFSEALEKALVDGEYEKLTKMLAK